MLVFHCDLWPSTDRYVFKYGHFCSFLSLPQPYMPRYGRMWAGLVAQTTTLDPGGSLVTMRTAKQDPRPGNVISKPVGYTQTQEPVYKKCIKLVYYEACLARILIPQYCCECTTLQHTQYNAQNTKHYMHLNSGATFNVICQLRVITSRCSSEVPAASPSPSGEVGTSADHYYRLGHLCWCRDGSCSPKYGSGAP